MKIIRFCAPEDAIKLVEQRRVAGYWQHWVARPCTPLGEWANGWRVGIEQRVLGIDFRRIKSSLIP